MKSLIVFISALLGAAALLVILIVFCFAMGLANNAEPKHWACRSTDCARGA
jgi:hypothetical protein